MKNVACWNLGNPQEPSTEPPVIKLSLGLDAVPSLGNPVPESGYGSGGYTVKQVYIDS